MFASRVCADFDVQQRVCRAIGELGVGGPDQAAIGAANNTDSPSPLMIWNVVIVEFAPSSASRKISGIKLASGQYCADCPTVR